MKKPNSFISKEYRLKRNPFLDYAAQKEHLTFWVDREDEIQKWKKVLSDISMGMSNFIAFVIGDYGMGKSLALFKIVEECKNYKSLFPALMSFKGEEKSRKPGVDFIQRIFKSINFNEIKIKKTDVETLQMISEDVKNIYERIIFGKGQIKNVSTYFLRGELKPTQSQMRDMGVLRKIDDIDIAKEYLKGLLYLLKKSSYSSLILAIDEFEYLFSLVTKAQQWIYLAALRGLYDLALTLNGDRLANIGFFLAVSEDGHVRLKELEKREKATGGPASPLMRRVNVEMTLIGLNKKAVKELIEKRLRYNRIKRKLEADLLIPYTTDFIDFIYKSTVGKPGDIVKKCGHILDLGLKYKVYKLDRKFAKKALHERFLD